MTSVGILAELRAVPPRGSGCSVCHWLDTRPPAEKAEWDEAFTDPSIPISRIWQAMKSRGYTRSDNPLRDHRRHQ